MFANISLENRDGQSTLYWQVRTQCFFLKFVSANQSTKPAAPWKAEWSSHSTLEQRCAVLRPGLLVGDFVVTSLYRTQALHLRF